MTRSVYDVLKNKEFIKIAVTVMCFIAIVIFVHNDHFLYKDPVAEVTASEENEGVQELTLELKNTEQKGMILKTKNSFDKSLVYDEKFHVGDHVFLNGNLTEINGVKRDTHIAASMALLFVLLILLERKQGRRTIFSFIVNISVIAGMMIFYIKGYDILPLSIFAVIIMSGLVIVCICGVSRHMIPPFSAVLISLLVVGMILLLLLSFGNDINYDYMDYLPEPYSRKDANHFFFAMCLMGCLGAVMDIAVTITACSREIIRKTPDISIKALSSSVREIADDVIGTMINVMFFTNLAAVIPVFIVSMKNGVKFVTVLRNNAFFDISRFLVGGAAILIAMPVSMYCTVIFYKRKGGK